VRDETGTPTPISTPEQLARQRHLRSRSPLLPESFTDGSSKRGSSLIQPEDFLDERTKFPATARSIPCSGA